MFNQLLTFKSRLLKRLRDLPSVLIARGKLFEQQKAGKKWDSIVEDLRKRK